MLAEWAEAGSPGAVATVVRVERSAPRQPGAVMAVRGDGSIAGSVTGGCVEPAVHERALRVLAGGPPSLDRFGIADAEAFEVGLPCGGRVEILVAPMDPGVVRGATEAVAEDRPIAIVSALSGPDVGASMLVDPREPRRGQLRTQALRLLGAGESGIVEAEGVEHFVCSLAPRPSMYVFGAIDFAAALARLGRFLGYRVTVCDARAAFVTRDRFPDADELVVDWPHRFLAGAEIDERSAVCVLTHDERFDVPALLEALRSPAGYIGAMGSRRTTERRSARLLAEGASEDDLARIHAPIGLAIGSRTPEEVAVAIGAELIAATRRRVADPEGARA